MTAPIKTFDQVWEDGEKLFNGSRSEDLESVLKELELKIGLFKMLAAKTEIPPEEISAIKFKMMGDLLLTMTHLSLIENINVYAALKESVLIREIDQMAEKHKLEF